MTMDNEQELRRVVAQAERARLIIDDPLLVGAFTALETRYLAGWRATRSDDKEGREDLWHRIKALEVLRAELQSVLDDGSMARAALEEMRQLGTDTP